MFVFFACAAAFAKSSAGTVFAVSFARPPFVVAWGSSDMSYKAISGAGGSSPLFVVFLNMNPQYAAQNNPTASSLLI